MRHCARTNLALLNLLFEILHRDIHPEVAIQIDDDGVDATHSIKDSTQPVVVRNLCGPLFALQSEFLANELIAKLAPVVLGISHVVGIIVTCSTTELCGNRRVLQCTQLFFQAIHEYHNLFTQTGGGGRLTVCLGQHRDVLPLLGIVVQLLDEFLHHRIVHLFQSLFNRKRYTGVVDVLRSQSEVDKLFGLSGKTTERTDFFLDEVLYGLHVVIRGLLYLLHAGSILLREVTIDVA